MWRLLLITINDYMLDIAIKCMYILFYSLFFHSKDQAYKKQTKCVAIIFRLIERTYQFHKLDNVLSNTWNDRIN